MKKKIDFKTVLLIILLGIFVAFVVFGGTIKISFNSAKNEPSKVTIVEPEELDNSDEELEEEIIEEEPVVEEVKVEEVKETPPPAPVAADKPVVKEKTEEEKVKEAVLSVYPNSTYTGIQADLYSFTINTSPAMYFSWDKKNKVAYLSISGEVAMDIWLNEENYTIFNNMSKIVSGSGYGSVTYEDYIDYNDYFEFSNGMVGKSSDSEYGVEYELKY